MGEKSMLKPFWIAEQKEFTVIPPLSKLMDFPCYPYKTPYSRETLMELSTHKEPFATLRPYE